MKYALIALGLLATSANAATTISTTLTMTSTTAIISMTEPGANAYLSNASITSLSAVVSGTALLSNRMGKAHVVFNGNPCTIIPAVNGTTDASTCQRIAAGTYGVSLTLTLPTAVYTPHCSARGNGSNGWWAVAPGSVSNTTTGFFIDTLSISAGTVGFVDANVIDCVIY